MSIITLNAIELAEELADGKVSFNARNKTKTIIGMEWTKYDVREREEWKELFNYFLGEIKKKALIKK